MPDSTFKILFYTSFGFAISGSLCNFTVHERAAKKLQGVYDVRERAALSWPQGIVNYFFDPTSYDELIAQKVRMAMNTIEASSCIKFKPLFVKPESETLLYWLHFTNPKKLRDCLHSVIVQETGEIIVSLGLDCLDRDDILHSLLHAIGIPDEITHPDRDQYVRIQWQNIVPEHRSKFGILDTSLKVPWEYDPQSIMHFHDRAFSKNGRATISAMLPGLSVSPSDHLSQLDKLKLRTIFEHECNKRKVKGIFEGCKNRFSGSSHKTEAPTTNAPPQDAFNSGPAVLNRGDGVLFALI